MTAPFFLGIDIGTQGARVQLIDVQGHVMAEAEEVFALNTGAREEQSPREWWQACLRSLHSVLSGTPLDLTRIIAVAVTSTSGTVIPLDAQREPLHPAIMYSDPRSSKEAALCRELALQAGSSYTGFNNSSGLSKMVWFAHTFPEKVQKICYWVHAADYITGKLSGRWGITDYTNALKSGYDLQKLAWPSYIYEQLPVQQAWLPEVVPSGTPVGTLDPSVAAELGLPAALKVVAGITDGCASQIASGAVNLGDWNTTIGTTLVVKGVTKKEIKDPHDSLYNHRHPDGYWMPGGASNTGADWVTKDFKDDLAALNEQSIRLIPTGKMVYPLQQQGERFPFIAPEARGFEPEGLSRAERYTAGMEGVAYIERYAYELIEHLSGEKVGAVYTAGGASNSAAWLTIRSHVLNRPLYKMKQVSGAFGAAILAASKTHFTGLVEAAQALTQIEKEIHPEKELAEKYEQGYQAFLQILQEKGYIKERVYA